MIEIVKVVHFIVVILAVVLFVITFYRQKKTQKQISKKVLVHLHLGIIVTGFFLLWSEWINPFSVDGYWFIEKLGAFCAYCVMVYVALNEQTRKGMSFLAVLGAFAWLVYIGQLVVSKQAILLVG